MMGRLDGGMEEANGGVPCILLGTSDAFGFGFGSRTGVLDRYLAWAMIYDRKRIILNADPLSTGSGISFANSFAPI